MKKINEMNGTERIAYRNIKGVFDWEVGGWYNCIQDGEPEYIPDTFGEAVAQIYEQAMNDYAENGWYRTGRAPREMRFAGKEFIEECLLHFFRTDGDAAEIAEEKEWDMTETPEFKWIEKAM